MKPLGPSQTVTPLSSHTFVTHTFLAPFSHLSRSHIQLGPGGRELEEERNSLAAALERLAQVQRELAEAQRNLMLGQKQLAEQQGQVAAAAAAGGGGGGKGGMGGVGVGGSPGGKGGGRQSIA